MPKTVAALLESPILWFIARLALAVVFVSSGLAKLIDFDAGMQEMRGAGLEPAPFFNLATIGVLLGGATLILLDRLVWLGAAVLSVFLILTILIVHTFWSQSGGQAQLSLFFALEHVSVVGGLIAVAIANHQRHRANLAMPR
jgi:transmembrane protein